MRNQCFQCSVNETLLWHPCPWLKACCAAKGHLEHLNDAYCWHHPAHCWQAVGSCRDEAGDAPWAAKIPGEDQAFDYFPAGLVP